MKEERVFLCPRCKKETVDWVYNKDNPRVTVSCLHPGCDAYVWWSWEKLAMWDPITRQLLDPEKHYRKVNHE